MAEVLVKLGEQLRSLEVALAQIPRIEQNSETLEKLNNVSHNLKDLHGHLFSGSESVLYTRLEATSLDRLVQSMRPIIESGLHFASSLVRVDALTEEVRALRRELLGERVETQKLRERVEDLLESRKDDQQKWKDDQQKWKEKEERYESTLDVFREAAAKRIFYEVIDLLEAMYWARTTEAARPKKSLRQALSLGLLNEEEVATELGLTSLTGFLNFIDLVKRRRRPVSHVSKRESNYVYETLEGLADDYLGEGDRMFFKKALQKLGSDCGVDAAAKEGVIRKAYQALGKEEPDA